MEADTCAFGTSLQTAPQAAQVADMKMQLEGRFRFLWGIYRAHSEVRPSALPTACALAVLLGHSFADVFFGADRPHHSRVTSSYLLW